MKTQNDILAEYVRLTHPEIESSIGFIAYLMSQRIIEFGNIFGEYMKLKGANHDQS